MTSIENTQQQVSKKIIISNFYEAFDLLSNFKDNIRGEKTNIIESYNKLARQIITLHNIIENHYPNGKIYKNDELAQEHQLQLDKDSQEMIEKLTDFEREVEIHNTNWSKINLDTSIVESGSYQSQNRLLDIIDDITSVFKRYLLSYRLMHTVTHFPTNNQTSSNYNNQ